MFGGQFCIFFSKLVRDQPYSFRVKGVIEDYNEYTKFGNDQRKSVAASDEDDSDLSDLLSDDDEIFQQYRKSKMNQINAISKPTNDDPKSVRFKITLEELTLDNYVSMSDSDGHGRFCRTIFGLLYYPFLVIVCMYDSNDENADLVLRNLTEIAEQTPHVKFCRANRATVQPGKTNQLERISIISR